MLPLSKVIPRRDNITAIENPSVLLVDEDAERRRALRVKIQQGLTAAEVLKRRIRTSTSPPSSTSSTAFAATTGASSASTINSSGRKSFLCEALSFP